MTRTTSGAGRGRCMARLIVAEMPPVPQARSWNTASIGNPRASQNSDSRGGMTRDCGGNPGHETTCMSRSNQGASNRCSERVTLTSNAWLGFRLTKANSPAKRASVARPNAIAPRPRASARRGGNTSRTVRRPVGVSVRTAGVWNPGLGALRIRQFHLPVGTTGTSDSRPRRRPQDGEASANLLSRRCTHDVDI